MSNPQQNATVRSLAAQVDVFAAQVKAAKAAGLPTNVDVTSVLNALADLKQRASQNEND